MVVSKRVANAKSERFYKRTGPLGKKKEPSFWQGVKKKLSAHPLLFTFIFVIMLTSGIVTFWMNERHSRGMFAGVRQQLNIPDDATPDMMVEDMDM